MPASQQPTLVEERVISGRGVLIYTPPADVRHLWLYINVVRLPRVNFDSSKYNPSRSDYGKITWSLKEYVVREDAINYENQEFQQSVDPVGYLSTYMVCAYRSIIDYLDYLAPYIPAPPLPTNPDNKIYVEPLYSVCDKIRFVLRADTAIVVRLYQLLYDVNCVEATLSPKESPSPLPIPSVPIGTSIGTSAPYVEPNDSGDTIPVPGDEPVAPPTDSCIRIRNKGLQSGDIVFENFVCGVSVSTPPGTPFQGQNTVDISVLNAANVQVFYVAQASYASNPVVYDFVPNDSIRQPQNSYGNCTACNT